MGDDRASTTQAPYFLVTLQEKINGYLARIQRLIDQKELLEQQRLSLVERQEYLNKLHQIICTKLQSKTTFETNLSKATQRLVTELDQLKTPIPDITPCDSSIFNQSGFTQDEKTVQVLSLDTQLKKFLAQLQRPSLLLRLIAIKQQIAELRSVLDIPLTKKEPVQSFIKQLSVQNDTLIRLEEDLTGLRQTTKTDALITEVRHALVDITRQIEKFVLSNENKEMLRGQFTENKDTEQLIRIHERNTSGVTGVLLSYLSTSSIEQSERDNFPLFLRYLQQHHFLQRLLTLLEEPPKSVARSDIDVLIPKIREEMAQIAMTDTLTKELYRVLDALAPTSEESIIAAGSIKTRFPNFNHLTNQLINMVNASLEDTTQPLTEQEIWLVLMKTITTLRIQQEKNNFLIAKATQLIKLNAELMQLRTQNGFLANQDEQLPSESELADAKREQEQRSILYKATVQTLHDSCQNYLNAVKMLHDTHVDIQSAFKSLQDGLTALDEVPSTHLATQLFNTQRQLIQQHITNINNQLTTISNEIMFLVEQSEHLTQEFHPSPAVRHETIPSPETTSPMSSADEHALQQWHETITQWLKELSPLQFAPWYTDLYTAMATQGIFSDYRHFYLVKDIFFELEHHDLSVLIEYQRLCPNPQTDLAKLLRLKTNIPLQEGDIPRAFINTYTLYEQQHAHLLMKHPKEAQLIKDIMNLLCLVHDKPVKKQDLPALLEDPRYYSLKRHRGFKKCWELIEDLFRWIMGKLKGQAEHQYKNKPCFFPTESGKLLDKANSYLIQYSQ